MSTRTPACQIQVEKRELTRLERGTIIGVVVVPFLVLVYCAYFLRLSILNLVILTSGYIYTALGVTIGFHRLLTHNAFQTYNWVKSGFQIAGLMSVQGRYTDEWGPNHFVHHLHSDTENDLHSPLAYGSGFWGVLRGLWHAHIGWMLNPHMENWRDFIPEHLKSDPELMVIIKRNDRRMPLWIALGLIIPPLVGGIVTHSFYGAWTAFLWGDVVRVCLMHHVTWSINSICHMFGYRNFNIADNSMNNPLFGILGLGEGYHNNHHKFQKSAWHGLFWYELDPSGIWISYVMRPLGLAKNINRPTEEDIRRSLTNKNPAS